MKGINIYSGEAGLGAALTNPTELARRKGRLSKPYPVVFQGQKYADVESAYQILKTGDTVADDALMVNLIAAKLEQHPDLFLQVAEAGGVAFLEQCCHFTGARSTRFRAWEGQGRSSRFIRNLIAGFEKAANRAGRDSGWQGTLF